MRHCRHQATGESRVVLLGDHETVGGHRDDLAELAAQQSCVVADAFAFAPGEAGAHDELTEVDAVVSALGRAIADRADVWVPFLGADLGREQHWRRLSLVLQRHGLTLRAGRDLDPFPTDGGASEIDYALRREVQAVDELDHAALAAVGVDSLGREIERALADAGAAPGARRDPAGARPSTDVGAPPLPAPTTPWAQRQPMLKRYVRWLVHGCGVTQAATARVLNSTGQRTPTGREWQAGTVSNLLNGRYDRRGTASR
ncbi:hypothetical protein E2F47_23845 [Mycobacterium eburneum]|nr:hypothetical protein [Mycobacterium eburneum]TDH48405.1 hypothetical protein E2F47_23845 [Mycobacterium eburneum]